MIQHWEIIWLFSVFISLPLFCAIQGILPSLEGRQDLGFHLSSTYSRTARLSFGLQNCLSREPAGSAVYICSQCDQSAAVANVPVATPPFSSVVVLSTVQQATTPAIKYQPTNLPTTTDERVILLLSRIWRLDRSSHLVPTCRHSSRAVPPNFHASPFSSIVGPPSCNITCVLRGLINLRQQSSD